MEHRDVHRVTGARALVETAEPERPFVETQLERERVRHAGLMELVDHALGAWSERRERTDDGDQPDR